MATIHRQLGKHSNKKIKRPWLYKCKGMNAKRKSSNSNNHDNSDAGAKRIKLFEEMESQFDAKNVEYFKKLLKHKDSVVRTRAVCILAEIAGESAVSPISRVLKNDDNDLVRHEAAFSLGQLGFSSGIRALANAVKGDDSFFVRHEAAVALGVIGSEAARKTLTHALENDKSEEVRDSAVVALANLDYIKAVKRKNDFTRMTGG
jgi:HEAT repeat protein